MPKFFFDYRQEGAAWPDQQGLEFRNVEEAYTSAFRGAQDMWSELLRARQDPRRCAFEIRNAQRELLFLLPFSEVIDACRRAPGSPDILGTYRTACATREKVRRASGEFREQLLALRGTLDQSRALILQEI